MINNCTFRGNSRHPPKGAPEAEAEATLKMEALSSAKANLIQGPGDYKDLPWDCFGGRILPVSWVTS